MAKKYERENRNPRQIIRIDGSDSFMEIVAPTPDFNKIIVNVIKYNKETKKQIFLISNYFEISEWLQLCHYMKFGRVTKEVEAAKANLSSNPYPRVRLKQGGSEKDGKIVARTMFFSPATKSKNAQVMLCVERGAGNKTPEGLFYIDYKGSNIERASVPLTYEDLDKIAIISEARISAYLTARQIRGDFDDEVRDRATSDGTAEGLKNTSSTPSYAGPDTQIVDQIDELRAFY